MLQHSGTAEMQIAVPETGEDGVRHIEVPVSMTRHTPDSFQRLLSACSKEEVKGYRFDFHNQEELHPVVLSILLCFVKKLRMRDSAARLEFVNVSDTIHAFMLSTRLIDRCRILFPET